MTRFRLAADLLLRLRQRREQTARHALARVCGSMAAAQARLVELEQAMDRSNTTARESLLDGGDAMNLRLYRQFVTGLGLEIEDQKTRLRLLEESLRQRRVELTDAVKNRRALSMLRDRMTQDRQREQQRVEACKQDDLFASHGGAMRH